jgi:hypothetical protein
MTIWYILCSFDTSCLGIMYQEKSGNPDYYVQLKSLNFFMMYQCDQCYHNEQNALKIVEYK